MDFSEIIAIRDVPGILAKYSWKAKMLACRQYVRQAMDCGRCYNVDNVSSAPTPWELNQYVALSATYCDGKEDYMPDSVFRKIINSFRESPPKKLPSTIQEIKNYLSFEIGTIQIPFQQDGIVLLFRYLFIMTYVDKCSKIDMGAEFEKCFGIRYEAVFQFCLLTYFAAAENMEWGEFFYAFCNNFSLMPNKKFLKIISLFTKGRTSLAKTQGALFEFSTNGVGNALNLLEKHPFINMGNVLHLPLPYLLNHAATRHLFDRMMTISKGARAKVGKLVMEPYVLNLLTYAGCYRKVLPEFKYKYKGKEKTSPDAWLITRDVNIFLEVKLAEAPSELRQTIKRDVQETYRLASKHVFQLFSRIKELCEVKGKTGVNFNNTFGVVVLHEDSYAVREDIYNRCYNEHPSLNEEEKNFIRDRIAIVGLYSIENFCYRHMSILPPLEKRLVGKGYEEIALNTDTLRGTKLDLPWDEKMLRSVSDTLFDNINNGNENRVQFVVYE